MIIYSLAHSSYGLLWIVKHFASPDASLNAPINVVGGIISWVLILGPYLVPAFLIASGYSQPITD